MTCLAVAVIVLAQTPFSDTGEATPDLPVAPAQADATPEISDGSDLTESGLDEEGLVETTPDDSAGDDGDATPAEDQRSSFEPEPEEAPLLSDPPARPVEQSEPAPSAVPEARSAETAQPRDASPPPAAEAEIHADTSQANAALLAQWISHWSQPVEDSPVTGIPAPLTAALPVSGDRSARFDVVARYWELWAALARLRVATEHRSALSEIAGHVDPGSETAAEANIHLAEAAADHKQAEELAVTAQHALQVRMAPRAPALPFIGNTPRTAGPQLVTPPPLPADMPLVSPYRTNFESLFAAQAPPADLARIHQSLPLQHATLLARAEQVEAGRRWFAARAGRWQATGAGPRELDMLRRHRDAQLQLIAAVVRYNGDVASYALAVAAAGAPRESVVGMLIEAPRPIPQQGAVPGQYAPPGFYRPGPGQPLRAAPGGVSRQPQPADSPRTASPPLRDPQASLPTPPVHAASLEPASFENLPDVVADRPLDASDLPTGERSVLRSVKRLY